MITDPDDIHDGFCHPLNITKKIVLIWCCVLLVSGCAKPPPSPEPGEVSFQDIVALPATFTGQIPCEDCERVDIVLNLRPDNLYQLRKSYQSVQGPVKVDAQMGSYLFSAVDNLLILGKQKGLLKTYLVVNNQTLRFVEWQGTDNKSQIQYDLTRSSAVDPFTDVVKMRGMFSVRDGRTEFAECSSGARFDVEKDGDHETTMQNYLNTPHDQTEPLLLSILGSVRKGADPRGSLDHILIDQFRRFYPNRGCEGNMIKTSFTGTYWMLEELDGIQVGQYPSKDAPYLTFSPDKTLQGYAGCNRISGTYLVKGDVFLFNRAAMTRVACSDGLEVEDRLLKILDESETYRVEGEMLQLLDQNDQIRARFTAGP